MIDKADVLNIQYACESIINQNLPANSCLYSTALLYIYLLENTDITPKFCIGSIKIADKFLFKMSKIDTLAFSENIIRDWGGHAWIEINDIIIDLDIFKTIKSLKTNNSFQESILSSFGKIPDYLIMQKKYSLQYKMTYIAMNELTENVANALISNIKSLNVL